RFPRLRMSQGFFAQGSVADEIAADLGIDPVEFHRHNVILLGDIDRLSAQLGEGRKACRATSGVAACRHASTGPPPRSAGASPWIRPQLHTSNAGKGMACTMQGSGIAGVDWASAFLKMNEDGSFFLQTGASDVGAGADTVLSQIAAETLGVTLDKIVITSGDT